MAPTTNRDARLEIHAWFKAGFKNDEVAILAGISERSIRDHRSGKIPRTPKKKKYKPLIITTPYRGRMYEYIASTDENRRKTARELSQDY